MRETIKFDHFALSVIFLCSKSRNQRRSGDDFLYFLLGSGSEFFSTPFPVVANMVGIADKVSLAI